MRTMLQIPGYRLEEVLYEGPHTIIYRARQADEQPVVLKVQAQPTLQEMARLKQEYKIVANLKIEGVVKAYSLETFKNVTALVLEDFGGGALSDFIQAQRLTLTSFLDIAIQLAYTLEQLHQHQIVHKDIKPQNIIINPETGQVKITDFGIASQLSRETQQASNPEILEGTLAYMSPSTKC
jgi:serine/threonine protein kinase